MLILFGPYALPIYPSVRFKLDSASFLLNCPEFP